jgi:hypothetical protein
VKRVFFVIVLAPKTTFYLVVLLCTIKLLMISIHLRGSKNLGIKAMFFFCFLFYVVENGANNGVGQWCKTTRGVKFSKLSILLLIIDCVKSVLIKEMDVRMNAKRCSQCFIDFKSSTTLKSRIEHWSSIGF